MGEYIKREDAITALEEWAVNLINPKFIVKEDAICALKDVPDADVRPVVMCKDCEYSRFCAQYIEVHGKYYHIDYCSGSEHSGAVKK